jgi:hypothetical protein
MSTALTLFEKYTDETKYNILRPNETVMVPNPLMTVYANVVHFDVEKDTYPVDGGKRALGARALAQVAAGAGISVVNVARHDDGSDPDMAEVSVLALMKRPDGTIIHATGKKRVDVRAYVQQKYGVGWRESKPDAVKMYNQMRKFASERAETGAKNRAFRQLLAMKSAYTPQELARPFVIPQIVVNMAEIVKDEYGRRLAIQQALGAAQQMFGSHVDMPQATLPTATSAAQALPPAEEPRALPPAVQPEETAEDPVQLWTDAMPLERLQKLETLLAEREHGLTDPQVDQLRKSDAHRQAKGIVYLTDRPMRLHWRASEKQMKRLYAIAKSAGYDSQDLHTLVAARYNGLASLGDLTREQYEELTGTDTDAGWLAGHPHKQAKQEVQDDPLPF